MTRAACQRPLQRGFSIVEFMVSTTIGLILLAAVASIMFNSRVTYRSNDALARIDDSARLALSRASQDTRMAGYRGCGGDRASLRASPFSAMVNVLPTPLAYSDDFVTSIQGFEGNGGAFTPALNAWMGAVVPAPDVNSDILTVRVPIGAPIPLVGTMASRTAPLALASAAGLANGTRVVLSNCQKATAFAISDASNPAAVTHTLADNAMADLGWAFDIGASLVPMTTVTWYVGDTPAAAGQTGGKSLYRMVGAAAPEEIIDGVDRFKVQFGESIGGEQPDGSITAERYGGAGSVANWSNVLSVRFDLLMRAVDGNTTANGQTYRFGGQAQTSTDLRLRAPFTATASLRNRYQ